MANLVIVMRVSGYSSGYTPLANHPGWFLVESFGFVVTSSQSFGSGHGTDRESRQPHEEVEFNISRVQDALSVALMRLIAEGSSIREVVLELLRDGKLIVRYIFDTLTVTSFSNAIGGAEQPIERVRFRANSFRAQTA